MTVIYNADVEQDEPAPVAAEATPLQFLQAVYRNAGLPLATRIRAAQSAAQYCHPRISVIASPGDPRNIADRLEQLIRQQQRKPPPLIEHEPRIRRRI